MKLIRLLLIFAMMHLLAGCFPVIVTVHDGLKTKVLDAETKEPLENAFVYNRFGNSSPLAYSNRNGDIRLKPRRWFDIVMFTGEAMVQMELWVCKNGYNPFQVGGTYGLNADFLPPTTYEPDTVELTKSLLPPKVSCTDQEALLAAKKLYIKTHERKE